MKLLSDYVSKIQERIDREKEALARGSATSFDDYARACGVINGLGLAINILKDLFQSTPIEERD